jgi:hypothetical protein
VLGRQTSTIVPARWLLRASLRASCSRCCCMVPAHDVDSPLPQDSSMSIWLQHQQWQLTLCAAAVNRWYIIVMSPPARGGNMWALRLLLTAATVQRPNCTCSVLHACCCPLSQYCTQDASRPETWDAADSTDCQLMGLAQQPRPAGCCKPSEWRHRRPGPASVAANTRGRVAACGPC